MSINKKREVIGFLKKLDFDTAQIKEVYSELMEETEDFEVNDYRFIHVDAIDKIQQSELENDLYLLGCFNASFLADCSGLPVKLIRASQNDDEYETVGEAMLPHIKKIQAEYSSLDGYGHHFSSYDGNELELLNYYVFRIN